MTRSFMLAVSGFALLSAACSPSNDVVMDDDDTDLETADSRADDSLAMNSGTASGDPLAGEQPGDTMGGADSMDSLRNELVADEPMNDDAAADAMTDGNMANFGLDYAGLWGTEAQCTEGRTYAFSASTITTPDGDVCEVLDLEEGAGQVEMTGLCETENGAERDERTWTLARQDDGSLSVMSTAEVTVARCSSFEDESSTTAGTDETE